MGICEGITSRGSSFFDDDDVVVIVRVSCVKADIAG